MSYASFTDAPSLPSLPAPEWTRNPLECRELTSAAVCEFLARPRSDPMLIHLFVDSSNAVPRTLCDLGNGFCDWHTFLHKRYDTPRCCSVEGSPMCYCHCCPFCGARDPFRVGFTRRFFFRQYCLPTLRHPDALKAFLRRYNPLYAAETTAHTIRVVAPVPHWSPSLPIFGSYKRRFITTVSESTGECEIEN